MHTAKQVCKRA